jgi:hypothetical protein
MTSASDPIHRPQDDLLLAFRGTSYFLRAVSVLTDDEFDEPAAPDSIMSRRELMATVAYDARGVARLAEQIRTGVSPARTFDSETERTDTISFGAALPARALRHLLEHSAVHLRVEWRDLKDAQWGASGFDHLGAPLPVAETVFPWKGRLTPNKTVIPLTSGGRLGLCSDRQVAHKTVATPLFSAGLPRCDVRVNGRTLHTLENGHA